MSSIRSALRQAAVVAALIVTVGSRAQAQLPTVTQVYDKYATAIGGREAWAKVTDRAEKGTADITFAGISGTYERYYAAPNKFRLTIDLGVGKVEQGADGVTAWTAQPGGAAIKMEAADAAYVLEGSASGAAFLDAKRFAKVEVLAQEAFDGVACYKVQITTNGGRERTDFFEVASGLRRGSMLKTPNGEQKSVFKDYKPFDGKMAATKVVQSNGQGDIVITITSVTFTPNDPALFALPPGISK